MIGKKFFPRFMILLCMMYGFAWCAGVLTGCIVGSLIGLIGGPAGMFLGGMVGMVIQSIIK